MTSVEKFKSQFFSKVLTELCLYKLDNSVCGI